MAVSFVKGEPDDMWKNETGEDICVNSDKSKVVACDSEEAAYLLVAAGGSIPNVDAEKAGLVKGKAKAADADAEADTQAKSVAAPPQTKAAPQPDAKRA